MDNFIQENKYLTGKQEVRKELITHQPLNRLTEIYAAATPAMNMLQRDPASSEVFTELRKVNGIIRENNTTAGIKPSKGEISIKKFLWFYQRAKSLYILLAKNSNDTVIKQELLKLRDELNDYIKQKGYANQEIREDLII